MSILYFNLKLHVTWSIQGCLCCVVWLCTSSKCPVRWEYSNNRYDICFLLTLWPVMGNWECVWWSSNLTIFSWFNVDIIIRQICHWWNFLVWVWYPGLFTCIAGTLVRWHWSNFPATDGLWNCWVLFGLCAATALIVVSHNFSQVSRQGSER